MPKHKKHSSGSVTLPSLYQSQYYAKSTRPSNYNVHSGGDLLVMPAGPGDGGSSTRDLTVPAFPPGNAPPAPEGMSVFQLHTWCMSGDNGVSVKR